MYAAICFFTQLGAAKTNSVKNHIKTYTLDPRFSDPQLRRPQTPRLPNRETPNPETTKPPDPETLRPRNLNPQDPKTPRPPNRETTRRRDFETPRPRIHIKRFHKMMYVTLSVVSHLRRSLGSPCFYLPFRPVQLLMRLNGDVQHMSDLKRWRSLVSLVVPAAACAGPLPALFRSF